MAKKKYNNRYAKAPRGLFLVKDKFLRLREIHASMRISPEAKDSIESFGIVAKNVEILRRKHLAFSNLVNDAIEDYVVSTPVDPKMLESGMYSILHGWIEDAKLQDFSKIDGNTIWSGSNETI